MENVKKEKEYKGLFVVGWIVTILQIVASALTVLTVYRSNLLADKWLLALVIILVVLIIVCRLLMKRRIKVVRWLIGLIIAALVTAGLCAVDYHLYKLTNTLQTITDATEETTQVGVYVLKENSAESIQDAKDYNFGIMSDILVEDTENAVAQINEELSTDIMTTEYSGTLDLADALLNEECEAIIINQEFINMISETEDYTGFADQVRELTAYEWTTVVEKAAVVEVEGEVAAAPETNHISEDGVMSLYISGIDTFGATSTRSNSDVNIIAIFNTNTKQVLLVSTPRDFYVPLSISNGVKDKLTHAGVYGINVSEETLEMLYETDIDYYFRVNFSGFEAVINALGGVTVESDYTFNVGSYHFVEGTNNLNAEEALAFARERHSFAQGDRQRGKNQMAVIKGVISKMQSPAVLSNFNELLAGIEGSFESDIPYSVLTDLVKQQIAEGASWEVVTYSVNGSDGRESSYSLRSPNYVMIPYEDTVEHAKELIEKVKNGERVTQE